MSSENWKAELDERTLKWKAENHVAREKAEKSRAHWEAVREEENKTAKAEALKKKQEKKETVGEDKKVNETKKAGGVEKELGLEAGTVGLEVEGTREGEDEARWAKVGQAWEGVGNGKETDPSDAHVENGQIVQVGRHAPLGWTGMHADEFDPAPWPADGRPFRLSRLGPVLVRRQADSSTQEGCPAFAQLRHSGRDDLVRPDRSA